MQSLPLLRILSSCSLYTWLESNRVISKEPSNRKRVFALDVMLMLTYTCTFSRIHIYLLSKTYRNRCWLHGRRETKIFWRLTPILREIQPEWKGKDEKNSTTNAVCECIVAVAIIASVQIVKPCKQEKGTATTAKAKPFQEKLFERRSFSLRLCRV